MRRSKNDTLERLRRRLERRLGRPVDDDLWEWMRERGKLALYEDMGEAELEEHLDDVEEEYLEYEEVARLGQRALRGLPLERVEGPRGAGEPELFGGAIGERVAAYSGFVARVAKEDPQVADPSGRRALKRPGALGGGGVSLHPLARPGRGPPGVSWRASPTSWK
jgi:hypothetical protein